MRVLISAMTCLLLIACESRPEPLTRGQVMGVAQARAERLDLIWGNPVAAVPPDAPDPQTGRLLWQVYFPRGPQGDERVMLVNPYSSWAKPATESTVLRSLLSPVSQEDVETRRAVRGTWLLLLEEHSGEPSPLQWHEEVKRLNALALETSLYPLFGIRNTRRGDAQLIYGWHEESGIPRLEGVAKWIERRTDYKPMWIDINAAHLDAP